VELAFKKKELDQKPKTGLGLGWIFENWGLEVELEFTGPKTGLLVPFVCRTRTIMP
jgi:hypothetical protein